MKKILLLISIFIFSYAVVQAQTATTDATTPADITQSTADLSGSVDNTGQASSYSVEFWARVHTSTGGSWTIKEPASPSSIGAGATNTFTKTIGTSTPLISNTTYDYTIIVLDASGTSVTIKADGGILQFTTKQDPTATTDLVSSVSQTGFKLNGTANAQGGSYSSVLGWRLPGDLTFHYFIGNPSSVAGTSDISFYTTISGLDPGTTYEYVAGLYDGNTVFVTGDTLPITTLSSVAPTVTTGSAGTVSYTSIEVLANEVTDDGGSSIIEQGLVYSSTNSTPTTSDSKVTTLISGVGQYDITLSGLTEGTTYNIRAFATNANGTSYGSTITQATLAASIPTVTTDAVINISATTADVKATVVDENGSTVTDRGIYYGTTNPPTNGRSNGGGTGFYTTTFTGATETTHYYVQAYAENGKGFNTGNIIGLWTEPSDVTEFDYLGDFDPNDQTKLTVYFGSGHIGNGSGIIMKMQQIGSGAINPPEDGVVYTASTWTGSYVGGTVIYVGTTKTGSVQITNLDPDYDYRFAIYEYSGSGTSSASDLGINYYNSPRLITTENTEFPIELLSFTANNEGDNVVINWATASEIDNDYFEIERSTDAENFETIANVRGAGYSNSIINYSIEDHAALEGTVYYRLKQIDFDGAFTYSYVLPVKIGASNDLQISNIINSDNSISFIYNNSKGGTTQVQLLDMNGRIISTQEISGEGSQMVRMNMRGRSHGIYILHLTLDNQTIVKKVVF